MNMVLGFANNSVGSFDNEISGPGTITLSEGVIPEPATVGILLAGLAGLRLLRRRKAIV